MVLTKIGQEIFRRLGPAATKFIQSDKLVLNQAYKGFKHKSSIVAGIRTGLFAGSIAGPLISGDNDDDLNGPFSTRYEPQTYKPEKTRYRRRGSSRRQRGRKCYSNHRYRR